MQEKKLADFFKRGAFACQDEQFSVFACESKTTNHLHSNHTQCKLHSIAPLTRVIIKIYPVSNYVASLLLKLLDYYNLYR